jgi:hypothetical protein
MSAMARAAAPASPARPTPSRVELPLMNDTKKPPSSTNPTASTKPASADSAAANSQVRWS